MASVVEVLQQKQSFISKQGATDAEIKQAEEMLDIRFASDYRDYLKAFGIASYRGHELTGICNSARLNVVDVTRREREKDAYIHFSGYVIEVTNMDGIVIWQDGDGSVYQTVAGVAPVRLCRSLTEYIDS